MSPSDLVFFSRLISFFLSLSVGSVLISFKFPHLLVGPELYCYTQFYPWPLGLLLYQLWGWLLIGSFLTSARTSCRKHGVHPTGSNTIIQNSDLQVQVWKGQLWRRVHWGIRQNICRNVQRNTWGCHHPSMTITTSLVMNYLDNFNIVGREDQEYCQGHQRGNID